MMKYIKYFAAALILLAALLIGQVENAAAAVPVTQVVNGGTGSSTLSGVLIGNGTAPVKTLTIGSGCTLTGTTLSCTGTGSSFGYPFPGNATTTNITFTNGLTGALTGNSSTATALAANGTNCSAQAATGVDASGNAEGCFSVLTSAITALGPLGQTQTGATQTLATSSAVTVNGLTVGLKIVGASNTQTFTPTFTGSISGLGVGNFTSPNVSQFTNDAGYITSSSSGAPYPFQVTGNATSTLTQFNGGLTAYASSTIGNGTATGGLTISGQSTTTGLALFQTDLQLPYARTIDLTRSIPTTVGNEVDIGSWTFTNGSANLEIWLTVPSGSYSQNKRYFLPVSYNATANVWEKVIPISSTGPYSGEDADLEINVNNFVASIRIRRTLGTVAGTADVTMIQQGVMGDVFVPSSSTGSVTAPTVSYNATLLSQVAGKVGVGLDNPSANFQFAPLPSGSYSFTSWAGTGYTIPVFMDATTNNGGTSPSVSAPVLVLGRDGVSGQSYPNFAELKVGRYANIGTNARTRLDFALTNGDGDTSGTNILSLLSNGTAGVGSTTPWKMLSVGTGNNGTFAISTSTAGCATISSMGEVYSTGSACGGLAAAITAIGPLGQTQTGATQTLATSTDTNLGLTITATGNTQTFTTNWNGTLSTARGGLGGNFSGSTGALSINGGTVSAGVLSIANGGTNQSSFGTTNGIDAFDGTRLTNFSGYTLTGSVLTATNASTTNFTASQSLGIPTGSNPAPTFAGGITQSTNAPYQLHVGNSAGGTTVFDPRPAFIMTVSSTTPLTATTTAPSFVFPYGMTVTNWACTVQPNGATAEIEWQYANPTTYTSATQTYLAASTTPGLNTISTNNTPQGQATSTLMVGNVTGSPTSASCTFYGGATAL